MAASHYKPSVANERQSDDNRSRLFGWDPIDVLAFTGHELRNRLTALHLAADKLHHEFGGTLNQSQEKAVKNVDESIHSIESAAQKYLNLARASDPNYRIKKVSVDPIRDIIDHWMSFNAELLEKTGQTLMLEPTHAGILVWADPEMLYSVFDNLLNNAIKYGEERGLITIRILERGSSISFQVWNSGPGIPPEKLETIFERFSRGNSKPGIAGHGIGLYLARLIVEAHGGRIWADSRPGLWACFTFTLPHRRF